MKILGIDQIWGTHSLIALRSSLRNVNILIQKLQSYMSLKKMGVKLGLTSHKIVHIQKFFFFSRVLGIKFVSKKEEKITLTL